MHLFLIISVVKYTAGDRNLRNISEICIWSKTAFIVRNLIYVNAFFLDTIN